MNADMKAGCMLVMYPIIFVLAITLHAIVFVYVLRFLGVAI